MMRPRSLVLAGLLLLASVLADSAQSPAADGGASKQRALVLGGGGPVGEAWESGIIAGLAEKGVDLSHADLIVGTSAGSIVGARLAIGSPADLVQPSLARPESFAPAPPPSIEPAAPPPDLSFLLGKFQEMNSDKRPQEQIRAEIGAWALKVRPIITEDQFVASFAGRFPRRGWPAKTYKCTAVDAADGSLKVWSNDSGVPLDRAVASSCAFPGIFAPVTIEGHRYMDGGMRSATNADLATGYKTVVVVAPTVGQTDDAGKRFDALLSTELKTLRDSGANVELIAPDRASFEAFGPNLIDEGHRVLAAKAGLAQGRKLADQIRPVWSD
jgi:NTE family protein